MSDAALAVTQDASQPLRPKVIVSSPGESEDGDDDGDAQTLDVGAPIPSHRAAADPADADEEDTGSTRSVGAVRSGVAMSAPRSAPSVPYVGIPRSLQKWDRYEVQAVLGAGGMGAVYRARDPRLSRMVALKIIHPMLGQEDDTHGQGVVRRFLREARLQASLEHPHICKVYEIGELPTADGEASHPYICMQLISGRPLHRAQAEMSLFEKVRVIQQVAEALHTAHKQGLIHRDIKPSNIMVERTPEGGFHPYVMDFGLARETSGDQSRSGIIEGTPRYMAPEQARGDTKHLDRRTDVYALGVTLYELLVGRAPYETQGDMDTLLAVIAAEPTPLRRIDGEIPTDLEAVTLKCLEKEQSARYDSAKALAEDLGRYLDGEPVQARHIGLGQRLLRRARKHKPLVALAAALFLSLLGLVAYGTRVRIVAAERERAAEEQAKIAQVVGQQIGEMEWLLRSARQLPLHDLGREKQKVRERMKGLQRELGQRAGVTEGALHYALGRGHLALHEYDAALSELEASVSRGHGGPEVHYALGLVLGKLYE
ncbi:MAG: serine/threonine protein kinase, partial [Elusimicrobia bacterium]